MVCWKNDRSGQNIIRMQFIVTMVAKLGRQVTLFPANGTGEATVAELSDEQFITIQEGIGSMKVRIQRILTATRYMQNLEEFKVLKILPDGPQNTNYG